MGKRPLNTRKKLGRLRAAQRDDLRAANKDDAKLARHIEREGRKVDSAMKGVQG